MAYVKGRIFPSVFGDAAREITVEDIFSIGNLIFAGRIYYWTTYKG
jgi:hypothetical protein